MFRSWKGEETVVSLGPGDMIAILSDGVVEAGLNSDEEFGEERLIMLLQRLSGARVSQIADRVCQELRNWDSVQHDEYTVLLLRCTEQREFILKPQHIEAFHLRS